MNAINTRQNGNAEIKIYGDGTRTIEFNDSMILDQPLNIDIRVTTKCPFGYNQKYGESVCSFCHEMARTDGVECDYELLKEKLSPLSPGIELAIGGNLITDGLIEFLQWAKDRGFICNLTVNQGYISFCESKLKMLVEQQLIYGLGVSYRRVTWDIPQWILNYENTVFHVIMGIDTFSEVFQLKDFGVKKILCLGEKDFGFNAGNVDLTNIKHREWYWWVPMLFDRFDVVSFDNLALEQLQLKRLFTDEGWEQFNNGEHSLYINAVDGYFSPSSRSHEKTDWNTMGIIEFFKNKENN